MDNVHISTHCSPPHRWLRNNETVATRDEVIDYDTFLSHLCGGERVGSSAYSAYKFLSHLCGGEPAVAKPAKCPYHIGGLEISWIMFILVLIVHHHIGGLEIMRLLLLVIFISYSIF
jgi:hypothetical protein